MKITLLACFVLLTLFSYWLRYLNLSHLRRRGGEIPAGFEAVIVQETLDRTMAYTRASSRFGLWASLFDNCLLVIFLFAGVLPWYDRLIAGLTPSPILQGVLFFLILTWSQALLDLPFSLYGSFVLEERYGFNTQTIKLWLADQLKSQAIGSLLLTLVLATLFWLVQWSPLHWWLWAAAFIASFSLFMMFISPYLIEPLFNKFAPVTEEGLAEEIGVMMARAGLQAGKVTQMDASRRSRHSNAYFTGIGKVKRIVLFDTLITQMTHREIVAILAHEIGHWKLGHVLKRIVLTELLLLAGAWIAFTAVQWPGLPALLGLGTASLAAKLVILGFLASLFSFPLTPLSAWLSRRDERAADRFATTITGDPEPLATALIKLSAENLANLHPHPLYAGFYYSHPPVVERVADLRRTESPG